jgi:hypothetical protein
MDENNVGFEIPQFRIFEQHVLEIAVVSRFVKDWLNSLGQKKYFQHALDLGCGGSAQDGNPNGHEIRFLQQFPLERLPLAQDIAHRHGGSQNLQNVRL